MEEALSAEAGLSILANSVETTPFDIVLVDFQMPHVDGKTFAKKARRQPGLNKVRLVLVTSVPHQSEAKRLQDCGFDGYLIKPIKQSALYQTVAALQGMETRGSEPSAPLVTEDTLTEKPAAKGRILVVEDNRVNRKLISKLLEKEGYTCDTANDGQEGLDAVAQSSYDLILMDCQMPVLDGLSATRKIREMDENAPPIIALSAGVTKEEREACTEAGMVDFLAKPLKREPLHKCLKKFLSP